MEDDFFFLSSRTRPGTGTPPPRRCAAEPVQGRIPCLPAAISHPVRSSSWQRCLPAEHLLLCAGARAGVRACAPGHAEEAQVGALAL